MISVIKREESQSDSPDFFKSVNNRIFLNVLIRHREECTSFQCVFFGFLYLDDKSGREFQTLDWGGGRETVIFLCLKFLFIRTDYEV